MIMLNFRKQPLIIVHDVGISSIQPFRPLNDLTPPQNTKVRKKMIDNRSALDGNNVSSSSTSFLLDRARTQFSPTTFISHRNLDTATLVRHRVFYKGYDALYTLEGVY